MGDITTLGQFVEIYIFNKHGPMREGDVTGIVFYLLCLKFGV